MSLFMGLVVNKFPKNTDYRHISQIMEPSIRLFVLFFTNFVCLCVIWRSMSFSRHIISGLLAICVALPLMAQRTFVFMPQWSAQAQFAGYYVAKEKGFYADEGLDVIIEHPAVSQDPEIHLLESHCDATTLPLMQAMQVVDRGFPLVNILQTSMNSGAMIISRRGRNPAEQRGARVGTWRAGHDQIARCFCDREHMGFDWVLLTSIVNLYIAGAVDATMAMSYNEYYQLLQAGVVIPEESILRFRDSQYNIQDDGVYMTLEAFHRDRESAEAFARASRRGWEWAAENPEETVEIVMKYVSESHVATNSVLQRLMLDEILRLQRDSKTGRREFLLRPDMVQQASRQMVEAGLLKKNVDYEMLIAR